MTSSPAIDRAVEAISASGLTVCCAESCTGGLIGSTITSYPGASRFFLGSAVTYSNEAKESLLGVPLGILIAYGAVSEETAAEMARGARKLYSADVSVAVTGIAGPGGATETKPVGLVYIAVSSERGERVSKHRFDGDREAVRKQTAEAAITMLADEASAVRW